MYWDGERWLPEAGQQGAKGQSGAKRGPGSRRRLRDWLSTGVMILVLVAIAVPFADVSAATRSARKLLSAWSSTSTVDVVQESSRRISYGGSWVFAYYPDYLGGRAKATNAAGAKATLKFKGAAISWVGPIGPTRGKARVYIDGTLAATVNTYNDTFRPTRVLFQKSWTSVGTHRIQIVALGTYGHPTVALDAFFVRLDLGDTSVPADNSGSPIPTLAPDSPTPAPTVAPTATPTPAPTDPVLGAPAPSPTPSPTVAPTPTPSPTPAPTPTPTAAPTATPAPTSTQKVVSFGPTGTAASFKTLMQDMTVDVIEMQSGTYWGWHLYLDNIDRAARPLTIRPAPGATVVFDDTGDTSSYRNAGLLEIGMSGYVGDITFSGPFTVQNYTLGSTGLVYVEWVHNMTFNGFTVRNITASTSINSQNAHALYVASDGTHRGTNIIANDWNVDLSTSNHRVSGLHMYHTPQVIGLTALRWNVRGAYWGFVGRFDATNVTIGSWTIADCTIPFDSEGPAGVVKNTSSTSSGSPIIQSPMVDGGGNSWN